MQETLQPFSPLVYRNDISDEFHEFLLNGLDPTLELGVSRADNLAGNIDKQLESRLDAEIFLGQIYEHVYKYHDEFVRNESFFRPKAQETRLPILRSIVGPWVNYMRENDFNPIHRHNGNLSGIIFIDIPKQIEEDRISSDLKNDSSGLIDFWCNDMNWSFSPKSKQLMLFPSNLLHGVYPFKSNAIRITMSFNLLFE